MYSQKFKNSIVVLSFLLTGIFLFNIGGFYILLLGIVLLPVLLRLIAHPDKVLMLVWFTLVFLPMPIREYLGSAPYHYVNQGVVLFLWLAWGLNILMRNGETGVPSKLLFCGFLVGCVSLMSAVVNAVNPAYWGEWLITYLLPLPVIGITRLHMRRYPNQRLTKIMLYTLLFQAVMNFLWLAGLNPLRNSHHWIDLSSGTYGNTAGTAYVFIAAIAGGFCYVANPLLSLGKRFLGVLLLVIAGIQVFFTFTTHAHVFLPLALLFPVLITTHLYKVPVAKVGRNVLLFFVIVSIGITPLWSHQAVKHHRVVGPSRVEFASNVWNAIWWGPKVGAMRRVVSEARPLQLAIGMGPNSAVSYTAFLLRRPQTQWLIGEWYYTFSGREEIGTGSIRENIFSGTVMLLSEIGIIGGLLYVAFLLIPLFYLYFKARFYRYEDNTVPFLFGFAVMILIINIVIGIVWDVWRIRSFALTIWFVVGRLWDPDDVKPDVVEDAAVPETALSS